jgi:hypothetical protein
MFSTLRTRFGIPGVISVMALVFAMFGGAYAASNSSGGGKATASAKAKKGPRGKTGKTGPVGPAGPAGPTGPAGAAGPKGDAGANGSNGATGATGTNGTNGTSVTSAPEAPGPNCTNGGAKFTSASPSATFACNGAQGAQGIQGEPWTAGGTLPVGATETGSYAYDGTTAAHPFGIFTSISFSLPLANALPIANVHFIGGAGTPPAECENDTHLGAASVENPEADSGHLCIFSAPQFHSSFGEILSPGGQPGAGTAGAFMTFNITEDPAFGNGSWAVTG